MDSKIVTNQTQAQESSIQPPNIPVSLPLVQPPVKQAVVPGVLPVESVAIPHVVPVIEPVGQSSIQPATFINDNPPNTSFLQKANLYLSVKDNTSQEESTINAINGDLTESDQQKEPKLNITIPTNASDYIINALKKDTNFYVNATGLTSSSDEKEERNQTIPSNQTEERNQTIPSNQTGYDIDIIKQKIISPEGTLNITEKNITSPESSTANVTLRKVSCSDSILEGEQLNLDTNAANVTEAKVAITSFLELENYYPSFLE